jgi:Zn2+/Cd2+-exporting ATPase
MDEYFLMTIATAGAWLLGESGEAAAVMVFYQIGDTLQAAAVNRSRDAVTALLDLRPRMVRRLRSTDDTGEELVDPSTVVPGDLVVCLPGERIAVDGIIHQGVGALDTSAVTGESIPRTVEPGAEVHAGAVSYDARLVIRAVAREAESTVARMLALVEDAAGRKAPTEQMMTRLARYYTPLVVAVAGVVALVPPAVGLGTFETWIYRALVFLVVSCPCALVVSIPLGYFAGIGAASRRGILVKGGQFLDALARVQTVVFDKTGTITTGVFGVSHMISWHGPPKSGFHGATTDDEMRFREALLAAGYRATLRSNHPASRAIRVEGAAVLPAEVVALIEEEAATDETREFAGRGVLVTNGDERICAGSASHLEAQGVVVPTLPADSHGTAVHVGLGGRYLGCILVADRIRPSAAAAVRALRHGGVELVVLLSGDRRAEVAEIGRAIDADMAVGELLPEEKVRELESLMEDSRASGGGRVAFVGDGINDAAVIARADVGIAMGGIGSDAAVEAADVVLMGDDPGLVPIAIDGARRTQRIVMQNVVFALATKVVFLAAAASGLATMWMAVFADVGVTVLTVLNTLRILARRRPVAPGDETHRRSRPFLRV